MRLLGLPGNIFSTLAKGGMAFAIQELLKIPIYYVGLGEGVDDLYPFDPEDFANGILGDLS